MSVDNANIQYFDATRIAGEASLKTFIPQMGKRYTNGRNFDRGAGRHSDVSMLSPYVRRRLVLEQDLVNSAIKAHGLEDSEKFIQEVFWRGYFKGWLERRPIIWDLYRDGLIQDLKVLNGDRSLCKRVEAAEAGKTGLDYFDNWVEELVETGYLHNHARMWFASIWIFTLELPWRLGADFFFRHLLDGDPASNTLGWRWVAGLHTRGKPYQAQAWNIAKFTNNRFVPRPTDLSEVIESLVKDEPDGLPDVSPMRKLKTPDPNRPTVLLITEEDCRPEDFDLSSLNLVGCATLAASHLRSPLSVSLIVKKFEQGALGDTATRINLNITKLRAGLPADLARWATLAGATQIVTPYIPTGPLRDWILEAKPSLNEARIDFVEWRRDWDEAIWQYATAGFFKVKKNIPSILEITGIL